MSELQHKLTCANPTSSQNYPHHGKPQMQGSQIQTSATGPSPSLNNVGLALFQLSQKIGYNNVTDCTIRTQRLILADTLTYIEIIKAGHKITRRPRELEMDDVKKMLQGLIPKKSFLIVGITQGAIESQEWEASSSQLMTAAGEYIRELRERKKFVRKERLVVSGIIPAAEQVEKGLGIEKTLDKIEDWVDAWLNGNVVDWDSFADCLEK